MKVLKFGGSSLSSHEGLQSLSNRLLLAGSKNEKIVLVVSALEGATDELVLMCNLASRGNATYSEILRGFEEKHLNFITGMLESSEQAKALLFVEKHFQDLRNIMHGLSLVRDISAKTLDFVMSFGERLSAYLVTEFLRSQFPNVEYIDARGIIITDDAYGKAHILTEETERNICLHIGQESLEQNRLPVVTGFIGSTPEDETTTLGRGGSDFTAALLGAALRAEEIEFWTTVDGIMTADPRKVSRTFTIPHLTYEEALELGHFGAKVIYAPAMQPALDHQIPIRIKNTFRPNGEGSIISDSVPDTRFAITGISSIPHIALFQVQGSGLIGIAGTAKRLFDALSREAVNVILISQASSEHSICFAVSPDAAERAQQAVEAEFAMEVRDNQVTITKPAQEHSIVAIIGENMRNSSGIAGKMFQAFGKNGINIVAIAQGSSELNISTVIARSDESKALNALHDTFFLSDVKTINLFLAGTGLVGGKLLEQIVSQAERFRERKLEIRLVGIANSKHMLFDMDGIPIVQWKQELAESDVATDLPLFVRAMQELNLPNSIFVDCSASEAVANCYADILSSSISIVTPNKRANSGTFERYEGLKRRAQKANVKFFYETNVGAGLPVIGTLNDLIASGDEIIRIEAVLSGTLSYIFNSFTKGKSFSDIVKEAKAKGYTEPDPRDDLSGKDVARKLLILGREMGLPLEEKDIRVESLVPESCRELQSSEEFLAKLPLSDADFEKKRAQAEKSGETLRYIGIIENTQAQVSLQAVSTQHPFYSLSGSDNIVSFTTKRYFERPLVVKGPGAGTEVTAAGVLADIIRVASYLL